MNGPVRTKQAIGVILAGGVGARFAANLPKQFYNLAGKPIVEYALESMVKHASISSIYVVHPAKDVALVEGLVEKYAHVSPIRLVNGGTTRAGSTLAALRAIGRCGRRKVLFHDAVRPFLSDEILDRCIAGLDFYDAVDTVVPAADTIVQLDQSMEVLQEIPTRARLRRGQTPQGFWVDQLWEAYVDLTADELNRFTDDCGVLLAKFPSARIGAVEGDDKNVKITTPMDLFLAEQILYSGISTQIRRPKRIKHKAIAAIFGASSGLGLAAAQRLRKLGWTVEGASRSTGVDVRDFKQVSKFLSTVHSDHSRIDLVANFAGVLYVGSLITMDIEHVEEILAVNLMGSINVSRASHKYLQKLKGHLVLTASSSYYRGRGQTAVYSASKAAVVNLTQALADEWLSDGITVSCIVPRRADTPMRRNAFPNENQCDSLNPETVADAIVDLHDRKQSGIVKHVY